MDHMVAALRFRTMLGCTLPWTQAGCSKERSACHAASLAGKLHACIQVCQQTARVTQTSTMPQCAHTRASQSGHTHSHSSTMPQCTQTSTTPQCTHTYAHHNRAALTRLPASCQWLYPGLSAASSCCPDLSPRGTESQVLPLWLAADWF